MVIKKSILPLKNILAVEGFLLERQISFLTQLFVQTNYFIFFLWHIRKPSQTLFFKKKEHHWTNTFKPHLPHKHIRLPMPPVFLEISPSGILCSLALVPADGNLHLSSLDFLFSLSSDGFSNSWKRCSPATWYPHLGGAHLLVLPEKNCVGSENDEGFVCLQVSVLHPVPWFIFWRAVGLQCRCSFFPNFNSVP